jgi:hypothetical protein
MHGLSLFQEEPHGNDEGKVHKWARVHGPPMRNGPQVCPAVYLIRLPVMHTQDHGLKSVRSCVPKLMVRCCAQGQPGQVVHAHQGGLDGQLKVTAQSLPH